MNKKGKLRKTEELQALNFVDISPRPIKLTDIVEIFCGQCKDQGKSTLRSILDRRSGKSWICKKCVISNSVERGKLNTGEKNHAYGKEVPQEVRDRMKESSKKRWDKVNKKDRDAGIAKAREAAKEKYGTDNVFRSPIVKERIKATNLERYGYGSPMQSPEVQEKAKATNLERYGFEYSGQSPLVQEKIRKTMSENGFCSKPEQEVLDYVRSLGFTAEKSYIGGVKPFELDILIKEKNVAIEFNGDWWHSSWNKNMTKDYHLFKTIKCLEKGIQLIHIFGSEWDNSKDQMKGFIAGKLGVTTHRIFARKCNIKEVDKNTANKFLAKYHLRGKVTHKLALGLYYKEDLISLATFSIPHRQNMGSEMHLSRFATMDTYRVVGGLSKISSHAFNQIGPFVTFVERQRSEGDSYIKAGYKLIKTLPPDYFYTDGFVTVSKQSRKKSAVNTPKHITEKDHAEMDGLFRVFDCGKHKFEYNGNSK